MNEESETWDNDYIRRKLTEYANDEKGALQRILEGLRPEELTVLERRLGLLKFDPSSAAEVAAQLGFTEARVQSIESAALSKLRHPSRRHFWKQVVESVEVAHSMESIAKLTPDLISHLRSHAEDLIQVPADVFEHLVAELLASAGFDEIALVGRNTDTSADILAGYFMESVDIRFRVFVEVKRWRDRVGVEVFNQVLGAMISEKPKHGWHSAMIVALGGATETRKFGADEWRLKGIEVKDKNDLIKWLEGYRPNKDGLWVPVEG